MNIWLMPSAFHPHKGGVEELTLQLAHQLLELGHRVLVVTNRHPPELARGDLVDGVPVVRVPFGAPRATPRALGRFAADFPRVAKELTSIRPAPDIVHVQCPSAQLAAAALVARLKRAPLVVSTQGEVAMDADRIFQRSVYLRTVLRSVALTAPALTACSRWAADQAATIAPAFARATIVPNGVNPAQWDVSPFPAEQTAAAWGRHVPQKGFDLLLASWPLVRRALPQARLLVGGTGTETARLRTLGTPGVEFLGPLDRQELRRVLALSRVTVVPSRIEPFGIVALEAMASGRAVVWSSHGGLREATGGLGWPVDPNDAEALGAAIAEALQAVPEPALYRRRAEQLAWGQITARYVDIYERVLAGGGSTVEAVD